MNLLSFPDWSCSPVGLTRPVVQSTNRERSVVRPILSSVSFLFPYLTLILLSKRFWAPRLFRFFFFFFFFFFHPNHDDPPCSSARGHPVLVGMHAYPRSETTVSRRACCYVFYNYLGNLFSAFKGIPFPNPLPPRRTNPRQNDRDQDAAFEDLIDVAAYRWC